MKRARRGRFPTAFSSFYKSSFKKNSSVLALNVLNRTNPAGSGSWTEVWAQISFWSMFLAHFSCFHCYVQPFFCMGLSLRRRKTLYLPICIYHGSGIIYGNLFTLLCVYYYRSFDRLNFANNRQVINEVFKSFFTQQIRASPDFCRQYLWNGVFGIGINWFDWQR